MRGAGASRSSSPLDIQLQPVSARPRTQGRRDVSTLDEVTARRLAMLANGYTPLPVIGKMPPLNGWPSVAVDETTIRSWGDPSIWRGGTPMSTGAGTGN